MAATHDLIVIPDGRSTGWASFRGRNWRCALGATGVRTDKREGDGATPAGRFALRHVFYRADRIARPVCGLPMAALSPSDGWCDDPADTAYNRAVKLPYPASCERLWRGDTVYDLIVVLGHNDDPPFSGAGSAVFVHCARPDYAATEGCVAFAADDLLTLLAGFDADSQVDIRALDL